jgi:hypothetical protein
MLDPDSPSVCKAYAELRASRRSAQNQNWTGSSVRNEVLATVLVAFRWQAREPLLDVEVRFKRSCSLTRLEVGETLAIRTSEDPAESALVFPKDSPFYLLMREDFRLEQRQARLLRPAALPTTVDPQSLRDWFVGGGINCALKATDAEMQEVIDLAASERNPYG